MKYLFLALWKMFQDWVCPERNQLREQLSHLRTLAQSDFQWLAHNQIAFRLAKRYMDAASETWRGVSFDAYPDFRESLGLDPYIRGFGTLRGEIIESIGRPIVSGSLTTYTPPNLSEFCRASGDTQITTGVSTLVVTTDADFDAKCLTVGTISAQQLKAGTLHAQLSGDTQQEIDYDSDASIIQAFPRLAPGVVKMYREDGVWQLMKDNQANTQKIKESLCT